MTTPRSPKDLAAIVRELRQLPKECEWVEFKHNNSNHEEIGQYISALANSAALERKSAAWMAWGFHDATREIVGTNFVPREKKVGAEELENWLLKLLEPKLDFRFHELEFEGKHVVLLEIAPAFRHPVRFQGDEYIRVGSYKKRLKDFPEKERNLWRVFDNVPFERIVAREHASPEEVLQLLDFSSYFDLVGRPLPGDREGILATLAQEELIRTAPAGWEVTNLGAVLFAKDLDAFPALRRKAVRVVQYRGSGRTEAIQEHVEQRGYAAGFKDLLVFINGIVPTNEVIKQALRTTVPMYPQLAIRELVANALIHQDFFVGGAGPMIEIFADRMEITNPGAPLVEVARFVDAPPRSRNEVLASLMRRLNICEERGTGVDKVVAQTEAFQLPAPAFEVVGDNMRAVLFAHRSLTKMDKKDQIRACYLHACLRYVNREFLTNSSVRERFALGAESAATASRLIKEAVDAGEIVPADPNAGRKHMKYVPWWAARAAETGSRG